MDLFMSTDIRFVHGHFYVYGHFFVYGHFRVYGHFCVYGHSVSADTPCLRTLCVCGHCLSADTCLRALRAYGHCPCLRTLVSTDTLSMDTYVCRLLTGLLGRSRRDHLIFH